MDTPIEVPQAISGIPVVYESPTVAFDNAFKADVLIGDANLYPDELPRIYTSKDRMINYLQIRRRYPGVYPPIELDLQACQFVYSTAVRWMKILWGSHGHEVVQSSYLIAVIQLALTFRPTLAFTIMKDSLADSRITSPDVYFNTTGSLYWSDITIVSRVAMSEQYRVSPGLADAIKKLSVEQTFAELRGHYARSGYSWRYFMFYNSGAPQSRVNLGDLPLRPDTFEIGTDLEELRSYQHNLDKIDNGRERQIGVRNPGVASGQRYANQRAPFMGWQKKDLLEAIRKSGLGDRDQPDVIMRTKLGLKRIPYHNERAQDPRPYLRGIIYNHNTPSTASDYPVTYYLTLYRRIFSTLDYLNWDLICQNQLMDFSKMQFLAKTHYGITKDLESADSICEQVGEIAEKRRYL